MAKQAEPSEVRPHTSPQDFARLIAAGKIPESEVPQFRTVFERWKLYFDTFQEQLKHECPLEQQIKLLDRAYGDCGRVLNTLNHASFLFSFIAHRTFAHGEKGVGSKKIDQAILRDVASLKWLIRDIELLRRRVDTAKRIKTSKKNAEENGAKSETLTQNNAVRPASDFLVLGILKYEAKRGRLGNAPPTTDRDRLVKFVQTVVELVEGERLSLSATRRRIQKQFSRAKGLVNPIRPDLTAERTGRARWCADAVSEYLKNSSVPPEDARDYAAALPFDPASDPRHCAREDMADWLVPPSSAKQTLFRTRSTETYLARIASRRLTRGKDATAP